MLDNNLLVIIKLQQKKYKKLLEYQTLSVKDEKNLLGFNMILTRMILTDKETENQKKNRFETLHCIKKMCRNILRKYRIYPVDARFICSTIVVELSIFSFFT